MIKVNRFGMNNRASPLAVAGPVCRLTQNAELPAPGIARKRRGIVQAVTIDMTVGIVAPYRFLCWKVGSTTYRIACGADAAAFVNGFNNYLYVRDDTLDDGAIYSDPSTQVTDAWGLDVPTVAAPMTAEHTTLSCLAAGYYRYAVAAFDKTRWVESAAVFLMGTPRPMTSPLMQTDKMQQLDGFNHAVGIPEVTCADTFVRYYRGHPMAGSVWPVVLPHQISPFRFMRLVEEKATGSGHADAFTHSGGENEGRLLDFATTVVPRCASALLHDGRWWHTLGHETTDVFKVYYTRGICPEIYAAVEHAILQELQAGLQRGIAEIFVPTECGPVTGQAAMGAEHLILCRYGAWPVMLAGEVNLYDVGRNLWTGCVSQATIAISPWGTWWVSEEGITLWTGQGPPQVISLAALDIEDADTLFATDLSGACGAFDVKHRRYICVIPKSGGGQIILSVQADLLPDEFGLSLWTLSSDAGVGLGAITGVGYDSEAGEIVFLFGTAANQGTVTAKKPKTGCYRDGADTAAGKLYGFKVEPWALANQGPGEQKADLGLRLIVQRDDASEVQEVTVALTGLKTAEEAAASASNGTIRWPAGEYGPRRFLGNPVQGRIVKAVITNTDAMPLEIREVMFGSGDELDRADQRPG
jgi:hypothetical protein